MSVFIAHAAWSPGRRESLSRLLEQVPGSVVVTSQVREHASVWAPRLWRTAYERSTEGEWCTFLNDDVEVAPNHAIESMLSAVIGDVSGVSLATIQPEAASAYAAGKRWLISYLATGPGYSIRRGLLPELLEFHGSKLTAGMRAKMNEDEVLSHWAWSRQEPFLQCLPALVKHDTDVPSTLGYDNHPGRVAALLWSDDSRLQSWPAPECVDYVTHPWLGEGRMRAVHRAITNGWDFDDVCVFCATRPVLIQSPTTGAGICGQCLADGCGHILTNARIG